jgi:hypothetical protein
MALRPRKPTHEELVVLELSSIKVAINNLSTNIGKWLSAVALAAANPADNTAEAQKLIDEKAAEIDASAAKMEEALNQFNQPKEN